MDQAWKLEIRISDRNILVLFPRAAYVEITKGINQSSPALSTT